MKKCMKNSLCLNFVHLLALKPNLEEKKSIFSNKFNQFWMCVGFFFAKCSSLLLIASQLK